MEKTGLVSNQCISTNALTSTAKRCLNTKSPGKCSSKKRRKCASGSTGLNQNVNRSAMSQVQPSLGAACPSQVHPTASCTSQKEEESANKNCSRGKCSPTIRGLLSKPTISNTKNRVVSAAVSGILTKPAQQNQHKYVVLPIMQPNLSGILSPPQYLLVRTSSCATPHPSSHEQLPCSLHSRVTSTAMVQQPAYRKCTQVLHTPNSHNRCCNTVASYYSRINRWLDSRRNTLCQTLLSVSERSNLSAIVQSLLHKFKNKPMEHVVLKWVGIALMILTKLKIAEHIKSNIGRPTPKSLYFTLNNIYSFFAIYEGCSCLIKEQRHMMNSTQWSRRLLDIEDRTFKEVVERMFNEYNRLNSTKIPTTSDLHQLADFIATLEGCDELKTSNDNATSQLA